MEKMRKMKPSGVEWIGDIPQEWEISRIKYVSDFQPTCDTSKLTNESIVTYTPMEYIKNGYYIKNDSPYGKLSSSLTQYSEGDIVMAKVTPCFENGNIAIMTNLSSGIGMGSSELFVFRAKRINVKYLFYWLRNTGFVNAACATMTGTGGLKRVSPYFVYNSVICFPKNNEHQQRIVEFLDRKCAEIDSVISKTKATIEQYKALKQSVITQAVTKGIRPDRPMKHSGIEWIGEIPQEWEIRKLFRAIDKIGDIDHYMPESVDNGIPYLMTGDLLPLTSNIDFDTCKQISIEDYDRLSSKIKPETGDVIFARYATIGTVCYVDVNDSFLVSYSCLTIKPIKRILNGKFLFYYLKSQTFFEDVQQYIKSNTQSNVGLDSMSKVKIILPTISEQQTIIEYLDSKCAEIDRLISKKEQLLTELESYKKSVIYEYVTGKKEV